MRAVISLFLSFSSIKLPYCLLPSLSFYGIICSAVNNHLCCHLFLASSSSSSSLCQSFNLTRSLLLATLLFFIFILFTLPPFLAPSISPDFALSLLTFSLSCPPSVTVIRGVRGDQREESRTSTTDLSPPSLPLSLSPSLFSQCQAPFFLLCFPLALCHVFVCSVYGCHGFCCV